MTENQNKQQKKKNKEWAAPPDISSLIISIASMALVNMKSKDSKEINLSLALWNIELLNCLKEKTKNHLNKEEEKLLNSCITDLRFQYITVSNEEKAKGESQ